MTNRSKAISLTQNIVPGLLFITLLVGAALVPILGEGRSLASYHKTSNPFSPFIK